MKLIIVESPTKAKSISKYLPEGFEILATMGHIFEIPSQGMNVDIEGGTFEPHVVVMPSKQNVAEKITSLSRIAEEVFVCSDPDREGERISFDIASLVEDKSKIKRAVFHEITKKSLNDAIKNSRDVDMNMVNSQIARQVLDRIIGYTVSPLMWNRVEGGKSAGRVQSVALRLVADREFEIEAFQSDKFWDMPVIFKVGEEKVAGIVKTKEKDNRINDVEKANKAKEAMLKSKAIVKSVSNKPTRRSPQSPYDTAGLQKGASTALKWGADKIMEVAQKLFELGKITYHRTDSYFVSDEAQASCREFIKGKFGEAYLPSEKRVYLKKTNSQEAHECIRPTTLISSEWADNSATLTEDEKKLLNLITARFVASQMADVVQAKTTIEVILDPCVVIIEGKKLQFDGWTKVLPSGSKDVLLPDINEGDILNVSEIIVREHETRPPERFNSGSLVEKMEKEGIGRPSTWANIIKNITDKNYIVKIDEKNYALTDIGRGVYKFLMEQFSECFMDIKYTSIVEEELDKISDGTANRHDVVEKFYKTLDGIINKDKYQMWAELFGQK
jgi:DNA topoisomerase-1